MTCVPDPFDGDAGFFMPCPVVADAGTGMVLLAANQKRGTCDFVGKIPFDGFRQSVKNLLGAAAHGI